MIKISTSLHDENLAADLATGAGAREDLHAHRPTTTKQDPLPRNRRLFQLDVNYRWSDIVLDERFDDEGKAKQQQHSTAYGVEGHDIRAGDRAPDAPDLLVLTKATGTVISETEEGASHAFLRRLHAGQSYHRLVRCSESCAGYPSVVARVSSRTCARGCCPSTTRSV